MNPRLLPMLAIAVPLSGCAAVTVVDTAVGAAATTVGTAVDVTAGAVDLAVPDGEADDN